MNKLEQWVLGARSETTHTSSARSEGTKTSDCCHLIGLGSITELTHIRSEDIRVTSMKHLSFEVRS